MPAPRTHKFDCHAIAETICGLLAAVPGARACFLETTRSGAVRLHSALINSPEVDRWHSTPGFSCVGVYQLGASVSQITEDVREVLTRAK